jgi:hypothetical protein
MMKQIIDSHYQDHVQKQHFPLNDGSIICFQNLNFIIEVRQVDPILDCVRLLR